MKLYIAGPMTGYPDSNYGAFNQAEIELVRAGYVVLNPARNPVCDSWEGYLRASIRQVVEADGVAVLQDWPMSAGAVLEVRIAQALRMPVLPVEGWLAQDR